MSHDERPGDSPDESTAAGTNDGTNDETNDGSDAVGSLGEEAAKLFGVLSQWTREQAAEQQATREQAAHGVADAVRQVNEHIATGGQDCRFCPVCQVIHAVRDTNPEVKQHLASAATSLLHAVTGLLETTQRGEGRSAQESDGVEKIDLDDD